MAAYLIGQITVYNPDLWQQYVAGVTATLENCDAEILFRGTKKTVLAGDNEKEQVVVIRFANHEILNNWFHSDKYQSIIPIRDSAAQVIITTYED